MPKQKTHSGTKDRFKITGTGKIKHRKQNRNHLAEHKPPKRTMRLRQDGIITNKKEARKIKRMLGR